MATIVISIFKKDGAVFVDAAAANSDRESKFSPELKEQLESVTDTLRNNDMFLKSAEYVWDQNLCTLTVTHSIRDFEEFRTAYRPIPTQAAWESAGWVRISRDIVTE